MERYIPWWVDSQFIVHWLEWKARKAFGFDEYNYAYFRTAAKQRKQELKQQKNEASKPS